MVQGQQVPTQNSDSLIKSYLVDTEGCIVIPPPLESFGGTYRIGSIVLRVCHELGQDWDRMQVLLAMIHFTFVACAHTNTSVNFVSYEFRATNLTLECKLTGYFFQELCEYWNGGFALMYERLENYAGEEEGYHHISVSYRNPNQDRLLTSGE